MAIVDNVALHFPVVHVVGLKITIQRRPKILHDSPPWGKDPTLGRKGP